MMPTILSAMDAYCAGQEFAVNSALRAVMDAIAAAKNMHVVVSEMPSEIAFCVLDDLVGKQYHVAYHAPTRELHLHLDRSVSGIMLLRESHPYMRTIHQLRCVGTYVEPNALEWSFRLHPASREACALFQMEYNACVARGEADCLIPSHYANVEVLNIQENHFSQFAYC